VAKCCSPLAAEPPADNSARSNSRGYQYGRLIDGARKILRMTVQIVRRTDDMTGFVVLPRRWVVERTLSWICQRRRCVRDYERRMDNHEAMVTISMIMLMSRRLTRPLPQAT
jgi:transposase